MSLRGLKREHRWLLGLTIGAFLVRLAFVLIVERARLPPNDTLFYHVVGSRLADGHGYTLAEDLPTARWPPAYTFLLSLVYRITGPEQIAGELLNVVLGTATVPLLYLAARPRLGTQVALVAAGAMAFLPGPVFYTDVLLAETLFLFMVVLMLVLALRLDPHRWWVPVGLGVLVGIAALTRGEGGLLILIPLAVWLGRLTRRELLLRAAAIAAVAAVVIAPWTIRNHQQLDAFVPVATNPSQTLWAGHNPQAEGRESYPPDALLGPLPGVRERRSQEVEQQRFLREEAIDYALGHPGRELVLIPLKVVNLLRSDSLSLFFWVSPPNAGNPQALFGPRLDLLRVGADIAWFTLLALTVAALFLIGRRSLLEEPIWRAAIVMFGAALVLYGFVFYGNARYHLWLEPLMLLLAAPLVVRMGELRGRIRPAGGRQS